MVGRSWGFTGGVPNLKDRAKQTAQAGTAEFTDYADFSLDQSTPAACKGSPFAAAY
jgi:hypothetical protein